MAHYLESRGADRGAGGAWRTSLVLSLAGEGAWNDPIERPHLGFGDVCLAKERSSAQIALEASWRVVGKEVKNGT
jgi:hypothetical protein